MIIRENYLQLKHVNAEDNADVPKPIKKNKDSLLFPGKPVSTTLTVKNMIISTEYKFINFKQLRSIPNKERMNGYSDDECQENSPRKLEQEFGKLFIEESNNSVDVCSRNSLRADDLVFKKDEENPIIKQPSNIMKLIRQIGREDQKSKRNQQPKNITPD